MFGPGLLQIKRLGFRSEGSLNIVGTTTEIRNPLALWKNLHDSLFLNDTSVRPQAMFFWVHSVVETWLWKPGCGIWFMESLLWNPSCENLAVEARLWNYLNISTGPENKTTCITCFFLWCLTLQLVVCISGNYQLVPTSGEFRARGFPPSKLIWNEKIWGNPVTF